MKVVIQNKYAKEKGQKIILKTSISQYHLYISFSTFDQFKTDSYTHITKLYNGSK